jgi:hypothetical protein
MLAIVAPTTGQQRTDRPSLHPGSRPRQATTSTPDRRYCARSSLLVGRVRRPNRRQIGLICTQLSGEMTNDAAQQNGGFGGGIGPRTVAPGGELKWRVLSRAAYSARRGHARRVVRAALQRRWARRTTSAMCGLSGGGLMRGPAACSSIVNVSPSSRPRSSASK